MTIMAVEMHAVYRVTLIGYICMYNGPNQMATSGSLTRWAIILYYYTSDSL